MTIKPKARISRIATSGGDSFEFNNNDKIIIVGPNNSGKSKLLREIISTCAEGDMRSSVVLSNLELEKTGTIDELKDFLATNATFTSERNYRYEDWQIHDTHIALWGQSYLRGHLLAGFIKNIDANNRLSICNQQNSISPNEQKSKPQHILYDNSALMKKISGLFRRAFGKDLIIDYRGGSKIPIHVGDCSKLADLTDRVSDEYVSAVRENPLLDKQGDGMRSYAGILFEAVVSNLDITLIDEPEAFLHPPQMRRLGETLSSEVTGQLIVATHSSDILRGFLEGTRGNVRILRIYRDGAFNKASEASSDIIKELWEKPVLRYSNALEGIFHEQTIICEDDSDCRLINSIADNLSCFSTKKWHDTAYVPAGGKHGIPKIAGVLRKIGVPVKAVFDIDFLSEQALVTETVIAFGGNWDEIGPIWNRVDSAVRSGNQPKTIPEIKSDIEAILRSSEPNNLPKGDISEAMKQGSPWSQVKKYGTRGIPNGDAQSNYSTLKKMLSDIGIYLVPVGELENFCPDIGSHGPKFVTKLLTDIALDDPRLEELRRFVLEVHHGDE